MNNKDIRRTIFENDIKYYEVANAIGITVYTFSHWLQKELTCDQEKRVRWAIKKILLDRGK